MEQAQIKDADYICIECREGITNPICPDCLAEEVKIWLREKTIFSDEDMITPKFETGVRCMKCGNSMNICAHCYINGLYDYINSISPVLAEEFKETFNF